MRHAEKRAVQAVRPAVIGAHERARTAFAVNEFRTAVAAGVFKGSNFSVLTANDNQGRHSRAPGDIIAGFGECCRGAKGGRDRAK